MPLLPALPSLLRRFPVIRADKGKPAKKSSSKPLCVSAIAMTFAGLLLKARGSVSLVVLFGFLLCWLAEGALDLIVGQKS